MPTAYRDLKIPGGGTVEFVVDVLGGPTDLTSYVGSMQFRELREDEEVLAEVSAQDITVNHLTRQVTVKIPSDETSSYDWKRGVYDLFITGPSGDRWQLVQGRVIHALAVTREE
jgi:hypothetical protein